MHTCNNGNDNDHSNALVVEPVFSIHKRFGYNLSKQDDVINFWPRVCERSDVDGESFYSRHWLVVATAFSSLDPCGRSVIRLVLFLCWIYDEDTEDIMNTPNFYLIGYIRCRPEKCDVCDLIFLYANDRLNDNDFENVNYESPSSFSKNFISEDTTDERQSLALLVRRSHNQVKSSEIQKNEDQSYLESGEEKTSRHPWATDELWLLNYDNMKFKVIKMETEEDSPVIINDEYPEWDSENVCDIAEVFGNNEDHDEGNMEKNSENSCLMLDVKSKSEKTFF